MPSDFARRIRRSTGTLEELEATYTSTPCLISQRASQKPRPSSLVDRNHALDAAAVSGGAGAICGDSRPAMPRLLGRSCASLPYAAGQALAPRNSTQLLLLASIASTSVLHGPRREVSERRLSATSKDTPVWDGRQPSRRAATFMGSVPSAVDMTAGHSALRGSGPGRKLAFDNALAHVGCPDRRIEPALHYVLFALPTFTSRRDIRCDLVQAASAAGSL